LRLSGKYTLDKWRAERLIEDSYKKRIQDTLIDSLQSRCLLLEAEKLSVYKSFTKQLSIERDKKLILNELISQEKSMKELYKHKNIKARRQRNWLACGIGVFLLVKGAQAVLKPP
jgi:hypothetical protein